MTSFRKVDYSLRPAKHAERKMLVEIMRRMAVFQPIEEYVYVGFGSVWFSDFVLFHRALGIRNMISIEHSTGAKDRIEANKPFRIQMEYAPSATVLPRLDWSRRSIVWLDYDDPLQPSMLEDVAAVAARAESGTLIAVSVQCVCAPEQADYERERLTDANTLGAIARFRNVFGRERVPPEALDGDLRGWPYGRLARRMLRDAINSVLGVRNLDSEHQISYFPICDIEYQDDARMTTMVGILVKEPEIHHYSKCGFNDIDFLAGADGPIRIEIPKLTYRELRQLEQHLPCQDDLASPPIPPSEVTKFRKLYRYFPNFAVMET